MAKVQQAASSNCKFNKSTAKNNLQFVKNTVQKK